MRMFPSTIDHSQPSASATLASSFFHHTQPLSTGGPSEGTRLLLGTDLTRVQAAVVGNPNSANLADQNLVNKDTKTEYLLAAGARAFDPNCDSPSLSKAQAAGCSVLGTSTSCGTGCGLSPQQEALWANANGGYFGGYPTSLWVPAGGEVWQQLRGTLTNMIPAAATGAAGDTMALLSDNTSSINLGTFAVPFNMVDRTYWITNATAMAIMQQIMMGTYQVNRTSFLDTTVQSVILDTWRLKQNQGGVGRIDPPKPQWGPFYGLNKQSPGNPEGPMPFSPNITFPGAQCFAATNPTSNDGAGTVGRGSGTSGAS